MEIQKYHQRTDGRTDGHLTWVGARDTCVSKKGKENKEDKKGRENKEDIKKQKRKRRQKNIDNDKQDKNTFLHLAAFPSSCSWTTLSRGWCPSTSRPLKVQLIRAGGSDVTLEQWNMDVWLFVCFLVNGDIWSAVWSTQFWESKTQVVERSFGAQPPCQSILQNKNKKDNSCSVPKWKWKEEEGKASD